MKNPHETLVLFGGAVKAQGEGKVGGHLVLFGDKKSKDLAGEWFTPETDFDLDDGAGETTVYYHHGLDPDVGIKKLSERKAKIGVDDVGVWIEAQLNLRDEYAAAVYKMAEQEKLGWSSGTAVHLIGRKSTGQIEHWPLGKDASLTPTPCDPRNLAPAIPLKSLTLPTLAQLQGVKSEGLSANDRRRMLEVAVQRKVQAEGFWGYVYVDDVFDETLVFVAGEKSYEAPYTLDGFQAAIGTPVQVQRVTRYEPVQTSAPTEADPLKSARDLIERARGGDGAGLDGLKGLHAELSTLLAPAPPCHRADFEREIAAALRLMP